jgi:hypothetical protein
MRDIVLTPLGDIVIIWPICHQANTPSSLFFSFFSSMSIFFQYAYLFLPRTNRIEDGAWSGGSPQASPCRFSTKHYKKNID